MSHKFIRVESSILDQQSLIFVSWYVAYHPTSKEEAMANKPNFSSRSGKSEQSKQQSAQRKATQAQRKQQGLNSSKNHRDTLKGGGGNNTGKKK